MKSKMKATATIATTYQITASGGLDGDALQRVRDPQALVDRDLERLVDLLPADHLEGVGGAGEQRADRVVVDRVSLLLEALDLRDLLAHLGGRLHGDLG